LPYIVGPLLLRKLGAGVNLNRNNTIQLRLADIYSLL